MFKLIPSVQLGTCQQLQVLVAPSLDMVQNRAPKSMVRPDHTKHKSTISVYSPNYQSILEPASKQVTTLQQD